ncbi:MAG TPA: N-acetylglucosamine-6-phosphate deacetylase [Bacteroidales bacterium]|jgi:N-acetylglucosamine-6-phosphate deacetylase|nr:N-acetylglucosamine-6-phosphate deacetylase [Bacteroidales bacterium]
MRFRILIIAGLFFLPKFAFTGQGDTTTVEGLFYIDEKPVSIRIAEGRIAKIIPLPNGSGKPEVYVAPGFIDIQINGFMGINFSDQALTTEKMRKATQALWKEGVTSYLPTVITNDHSRLKKSFMLLADATSDKKIEGSVPGFHLEGPFISPVQGYRGAHSEKYIRPPDQNEFRILQDASGNKIKLITVAPEIPGAISFIEKVARSGVTVSLGHHNGTTGIIQEAVEAGAQLSTHLGNGCANEINRHWNPIWPQLANDGLSISIICDGSHLNRDEVITFYKVKGNGMTILVSDALYLAGMSPGEYTDDEGVTLLLTEDVVKLPAENVLAGAAQSIRRCTENMMAFTGCSLKEAMQMASTNPARLLQLNDRGELKPGMRADLILFTLDKGKITIQKTIVAGEEVYRAEK